MVEALLSKLERIYGPEVREHAVASAVTSWKDDPWHLGAFTAAKPGYARMRDKLKRPVQSVLWFAGEASSLRWNGMAPGAYVTGVGAARGIAETLKLDEQRVQTLKRDRLEAMKEKLSRLRAPSAHLAPASP
jgi:monoamine oxidase